MKATGKVLTGLLLTSGMIAGFYFLHAQDTTTFTQSGASSLTDTNVNWNSLSDFQVEIKLIEATPTISAADLATQGLEGTFYSAQHINDWPPLPADVLGLPLWEVDTNLFLIDDLEYTYATAQTATPTTSETLAMNPPAGAFTPLASYPAGSLWLLINGITNGMVYLTLNGTTNGVQYQLLSQEALSNAPLLSWDAEGPLFWGSSTTNWTTVTVPQNGRSNLFLAAQSQIDTTGTGIPDWWWLKYFGQDTNVDAYGDPKGDGWNNLEKFQLGMDPNVFYTPPAPQGLTVSYDASSGTADVSWQSSPGPVTSYTVQKTYYPSETNSPQIQNFNLSSNIINFADNVSGASAYNLICGTPGPPWGLNIRFRPIMPAAVPRQARRGWS